MGRVPASAATEVKVMDDIDIVSFEPETASRKEWERFHRFRRLRHQERDPEDPLLDDQTIERMMKRPDPHWRTLRYAVVDSEDPEAQLGMLYFEVAKEEAPDYKENKNIAWIYLEVLATRRREGIGRRLLERAGRMTRERDRSLIIMGSDEEDGKAFIKAIGAKVGQHTRESRLYLDRVDWQMIEEWAEAGPARSPDTNLRFFTNYIDEDVIDDFADVLTEAFNQMPKDEIDRGDEIMTPERIREWEARFKDAGGTRLSGVTFEADGRISGLTEMGYFPDKEAMIHQFMTGVRPPYRGRGLGKWLKAAMLLKVRQEFPQVKVVVTGNATSNAAMLSINERMGFKPHREGILSQITLESLEEYLSKATRKQPVS